MKTKHITCLLLLGLFMTLTACNTATPENYFDKAILNTNMFNDFASENFTRQLVASTIQHTDVQLPKQIEPAAGIVKNKVLYIENALKGVKALKQTDDTREMLQTAIALHEYVLPVYKNEYTALAKMCDSGASKEDISARALDIDNKYARHFEDLFDKLTSLGKIYAQAHNINVTWGRD